MAGKQTFERGLLFRDVYWGMKHLRKHRDGLSAPCAPSAKRRGAAPSQRYIRKRAREAKRLITAAFWGKDAESFHKANLLRLALGRLPKRAAKYGCVDFDLEDESEYSGDDGTAVSGHELAGIAAYIVRCAKDPVDYLMALRNVPMQVMEPIKTYLRVKLALGRLNEEIAMTKVLEEQGLSPQRLHRKGQSLLEKVVYPPSRGPGSPLRAVRDDRLREDDVQGHSFPPLQGGGGGTRLLEQKGCLGGGAALGQDRGRFGQMEDAPPPCAFL